MGVMLGVSVGGWVGVTLPNSGTCSVGVPVIVGGRVGVALASSSSRYEKTGVFDADGVTCRSVGADVCGAALGLRFINPQPSATQTVSKINPLKIFLAEFFFARL